MPDIVSGRVAQDQTFSAPVYLSSFVCYSSKEGVCQSTLLFDA